MTRTTRNITLGLIGSGLLVACCIGSGFFDDEEDKEGRQPGGTTSSHSYRHRRFWPRSYWWSRPSYSYAPSPSGGHGGGTPSGGAPRSSPGGATSRGGFGGSGHATAGG